MNKRLKKKRQKLVKNIGEVSALRDTSYSGISIQGFNPTYYLDSSKVNYKLARQIYANTHDMYKLGAGFAKPIINSVVGFMGSPKFTSKIEIDKKELGRVEESIDNPESEILDFEDDDLKQQLLDDQLNNKKDIFNKIHKCMLRDGDCYVLVEQKDVLNNPLYGEDELHIDLKLLDPNSVFCIFNGLNKDIIEKAVITTKVSYYDENTTQVSYTIVETWTIQEHSIAYTDKQNINNLVDSYDNNPLGFIPIVKISNENDFAVNGTSELEAVEPYLRAYNDVMIDYLRTNRLTAQPKLKIKTTSIQNFLTNNFTASEISSKKLSLNKKNVVFLSDEKDEAGYVEVSATTHYTLLEFLFMCIVDVSETPEFAFGTAIASSKASASEQVTPLLKKVERKRAMMLRSYDLLARMVIAINNMQVTSFGKIQDLSTSIEWAEVDREDDKTRAETIKTLIDSFISAIDNDLMSVNSAMEYLTKYVDTMDSVEKERIKIKKDNLNNDNNSDDEILEDVIKKLSGTEGEPSEGDESSNVIDFGATS